MYEPTMPPTIPPGMTIKQWRLSRRGPQEGLRRCLVRCIHQEGILGVMLAVSIRWHWGAWIVPAVHRIDAPWPPGAAGDGARRGAGSEGSERADA